jgi:hypothetical protein
MTTLSSCASGALPDELAAWVVAAQDALEVTRRAGEWDPPTRQRTLAALQRVVTLVAVGTARVGTAVAVAGTWGR